MNKIYDLIIIGGGPAGSGAGVYAARKKLNTLLITPEFGGQSVVSESIENWIGTVKISGDELAKSLKEHLFAYADDSVVVVNEKAENIENSDNIFKIKTEKGEYGAKTVLITTGSHRRKLDIPGAFEFDNKGVTYCASCDGPMFSGEDVVVVGGGNSALGTAAQLLAYCKTVTLLDKEPVSRGEKITLEKLLQNPNFKILNNVKIKEIKGSKFAESIVYEDLDGEHEIQTPGIFVEIGHIPTTEFAQNILKLNQYKQIPVDPRTQKTEVPGIWAAGDCTDGIYHQNNIAVGDAIKAIEDIYIWLKTQ